MNHCMIDLETLGTGEDAVILSIGAVMFNPALESPESTHTFYFPVDPKQPDRKIDADTVKWWMGQSDKARSVFSNGYGGDIWLALYELKDWYHRKEGQRAWGHGATFDISILTHAYRQYDEITPWGFRDVRDTRTLFELYPNQAVLKDLFRNTHDALEDALDQVQAVRLVYGYLKEKGVTIQ